MAFDYLLSSNKELFFLNSRPECHKSIRNTKAGKRKKKHYGVRQPMDLRHNEDARFRNIFSTTASQSFHQRYIKDFIIPISIFQNAFLSLIFIYFFVLI